LVVNVILNRVKSPGFPTNIRDVVFAPNQFEPMRNGMFDRASPDDRIKTAVEKALNGEDYSRGALFFRAVRGAEGGWHEQNLTRLFDHGGHRFYTLRTTQPQVAVNNKPQSFKIGDIVRFTGGGVYISSTAATPVSSRGKSRCRVTHIANGAAQPYHLVSEDGGGVHGWVSAGDVAAT
jgi:hypothetical protein